MCEHKWVYQTSDYRCEKEGYYTNKYSRVDTYYCEKCCKVKDKTNEIEIRDINNGKPSWWR